MSAETNVGLTVDCGYTMPDYTYIGYVLFGGMPLYQPTAKYSCLRYNNEGIMYFANEGGANWKLPAGTYYVNQIVQLY